MLPREIQAEYGPEQSTFDLPTRPIGALRYFGLFLIGFAVLFAWSPGKQVWKSLRHLMEGHAGTPDSIFGVFTLFFVLAALMPFGVGLFILAGRTRVTITRERLVITEIAGVFRWSRRCRLTEIQRLEVAAATSSKLGALPEGSRSLAQLGVITLALKNGKHKVLLLGYPREWLEAMANEVSGQMQAQGHSVPIAQSALKVEKGGGGNGAAFASEAIQRPADSNVELTETAGGLQVMVPSRGFRKESGGLFFFGCLWCLFMIVFTAATVLGKKAGTGELRGAGLFLFLIAFWAIGLGMLFCSIHLGTRRWTLSVQNKELLVRVHSKVRAREWRWDATDLRDIAAGDSNIEVNDRRLKELQVHLRTGKKTGLLRGRPENELAWIAFVLRRSLDLAGMPAGIQNLPK